MLPNFLIIGAMKSGTTSLYHYLKEHPDVFMPVNKEPNFFSDQSVWSKGVGWYESLFAKHKNCSALGEASVNYTKYPHYKGVPERILSLIPDVRLIYVLRNPIDRVYSHYLHNVYAGIEDDPIEKAVFKRPLYVQASMYYSQIDQYLKYFPRESIMIIILDDMKNDPSGIVKSVFEFIGVDPSFIPPNIHEVKHKTGAKRGRDTGLMKQLRKTSFYNYLADGLPDGAKKAAGLILKKKMEKPEPISNSLRSKLIDEVIADTNKLSEFLERDLSFWGIKKD